MARIAEKLSAEALLGIGQPVARPKKSGQYLRNKALHMLVQCDPNPKESRALKYQAALRRQDQLAAQLPTFAAKTLS